MSAPRPPRVPAARSPAAVLLALLLGPWLVLAPSVGAERGQRPAPPAALARCARPAPLPALAVRNRPPGSAGGSGRAVAAAVEAADAGRRQGVPARAQALA